MPFEALQPPPARGNAVWGPALAPSEASVRTSFVLPRTLVPPFESEPALSRLFEDGGNGRLPGDGRADVQPGGGLLADRALRAGEVDLELPGGGLRLADHDPRPRRETLVVEPMQELAVVLGQP